MGIRRRRPRYRFLAFALGVPILLIAMRSRGTAPAHIDPLRTGLASGSYAVASVESDGALSLIVERGHDKFDGNSPPALARVRLIATEIVATDEAVALIRELIGKQPVVLRFDRRRITEDTSELQAWVYVDEQLINAQLVRRGLARESTHPADAGPLIRMLKKAEQSAREQGLGIWSE